MAAPPIRLQRQQAQPIHALFKFLQTKTRVEVWMYENTTTRLEGTILVRFRAYARRANARGFSRLAIPRAHFAQPC